MKMVKWSLLICRVAGIRIQIHVTFGLLLVWFWLGGYQDARWNGVVWATIFLAAIFLCVVLHELGHSLVAQRFGITVRDITLLPIGGVASLSSIPEKPQQELAITVAGPLVNVVIFSLLYLVGTYVPMEIPFSWFGSQLTHFPLDIAELWAVMLYVNLVMVVFNLLPAFPMDGGRILRASLVHWLGYVRATNVAATCGQIIASLFLFGSFSLLLAGENSFIWLGVIGAVIFIAAGSERRMVTIRHALRDATVADAMSRDFGSLAPADTIGHCLEKSIRGGQEDFPVLDEGELIGLLDRDTLRAALRETGPDTPVGKVMRRRFPALTPEASLMDVHTTMFSADWKSLPVRSNGALVGWLSRENIGRFFAVQEVLHRAKR